MAEKKKIGHDVLTASITTPRPLLGLLSVVISHCPLLPERDYRQEARHESACISVPSSVPSSCPFRARRCCSNDEGSGARIAQLVERSTEKPDAILTRVRVPGAATDLSPRVNFPGNVDSGTVSAHSLCAVACINICAQVKSPPNWQPYQCLDTRKYMAALLMRLIRRTQVRRAECPTGTMKY